LAALCNRTPITYLRLALVTMHDMQQHIAQVKQQTPEGFAVKSNTTENVTAYILMHLHIYTHKRYTDAKIINVLTSPSLLN
jgi:hypothetical protein